MEFRILNKETEQALELEMVGVDETVLEPLKQKLLQDGDVLVASYTMGHPLLENPRFFVKVSKGKATGVLRKAAKAISKEFAELEVLTHKAPG